MVLVAVQGEKASWSDIAARNMLQVRETVSCPTFESVEAALADGRAECALLPIESSHSGSFAATLDFVISKSLVIVGEFIQGEDHVVAGLQGATPQSITTLVSHASVLDQLADWISKNYPKARLLQVHDTAAASAVVRDSKDPSYASISSREAAVLNGLTVIAEPHSGLSMRYILVARPEKASRDFLGAAPGHNLSHQDMTKTSVAVVLKNQPGSLFKALSCFALRDLNVARIETRPSTRAGSMHHTGRPFEYLTFVDIESSPGEQNKLQSALAQLKEFATSMRVLGTFKRFDLMDVFGMTRNPYVM